MNMGKSSATISVPLDGGQAVHFSASQGAEQAGFSAQNGSEGVEDSCRRAGDVPELWSRAEEVCVIEEFPLCGGGSTNRINEI